MGSGGEEARQQLNVGLVRKWGHHVCLS